jgi:hypothetical protein
MRQRHQIIIVFSMLLMLCGQTLAGALMWCCLNGEAMPAAQQPAQPEAMMHMTMAHEHHDHAMPVASADVDQATMPADGSGAMSPALAALLDCAHSCASSCSNSAVVATLLAPQAPGEFTLTLAEAAPALPQTDPSLLLRPPNVA